MIGSTYLTGDPYFENYYFPNRAEIERRKEAKQASIDGEIRRTNETAIEKLSTYPIIYLIIIPRRRPAILAYKRAPRRRPP